MSQAFLYAGSPVGVTAGGGREEFIYVGSGVVQQFTVPDGVTRIYITACGGGGGASKGYNSSPTGSATSYAGGGAAAIVRKPYAVTSSQSIGVTVGAGGTAGNSASTSVSFPGLTGEPTIIGNLVTLSGGGAGSVSSGGSSGGLGGGSWGSCGIVGGTSIERGGGGSLGGGGAYYYSGNTGNGVITTIYTGGISPFGCGGSSFKDGGGSGNGTGTPDIPTDSPNYSTYGGQKGSGTAGGGGGGIGAGGGGAFIYAATYARGGNGGNGYCLVEW